MGATREGVKEAVRARDLMRMPFAFATPNFAPIPAFPRKRGKEQVNDVSGASLDRGKGQPLINAD